MDMGEARVRFPAGGGESAGWGAGAAPYPSGGGPARGGGSRGGDTVTAALAPCHGHCGDRGEGKTPETPWHHFFNYRRVQQ